MSMNRTNIINIGWIFCLKHTNQNLVSQQNICEARNSLNEIKGDFGTFTRLHIYNTRHYKTFTILSNQYLNFGSMQEVIILGGG